MMSRGSLKRSILGWKIGMLRCHHGWTVRELKRQLEMIGVTISPIALTNIELGHTVEPRGDLLRGIASVTGYPYQSLIDDGITEITLVCPHTASNNWQEYQWPEWVPLAVRNEIKNHYKPKPITAWLKEVRDDSVPAIGAWVKVVLESDIPSLIGQWVPVNRKSGFIVDTMAGSSRFCFKANTSQIVARFGNHKEI